MSEERTRRIQEELTELWSATFGEAPSIAADPETMIRILVECLKDPGPFELIGPPPASKGEGESLPDHAEPLELVLE